MTKNEMKAVLKEAVQELKEANEILHADAETFAKLHDMDERDTYAYRVGYTRVNVELVLNMLEGVIDERY